MTINYWHDKTVSNSKNPLGVINSTCSVVVHSFQMINIYTFRTYNSNPSCDLGCDEQTLFHYSWQVLCIQPLMLVHVLLINSHSPSSLLNKILHLSNMNRENSTDYIFYIWLRRRIHNMEAFLSYNGINGHTNLTSVDPIIRFWRECVKLIRTWIGKS